MQLATMEIGMMTASFGNAGSTGGSAREMTWASGSCRPLSMLVSLSRVSSRSYRARSASASCCKARSSTLLSPPW